MLLHFRDLFYDIYPTRFISPSMMTPHHSQMPVIDSRWVSTACIYVLFSFLRLREPIQTLFIP